MIRDWSSRLFDILCTRSSLQGFWDLGPLFLDIWPEIDFYLSTKPLLLQ